jgi:hypothetical protein
VDEEAKQAILSEARSIMLQMYPDLKERSDNGTLTQADLRLLNDKPRWGQYPALVLENFKRARPRTAALLESHGLLMERCLWIGMLMDWRIALLMEREIDALPTQPDHPGWRMHIQRQAEEVVLPSMLLEELPEGTQEPEMAGAMNLLKARGLA